MKTKLIILLNACLLLFACSNKEDFEPTRIDGKPSSIASNTGAPSYFYYQSDRIHKVKFPEQGYDMISEYKYNEGKLEKIDHYLVMNSVDVSDVNFTRTFEKKDNIVTMTHKGQNPYVYEIELDNNAIPVKLHAKHGANEYLLTYSYESPGNKLTKVEKYEVGTSKLLETYEFEYDNSPGIMSKTGISLLEVVTEKSYVGSYDHFRYNLCYSGNVTKINIKENKPGGIQKTINYKYTYNQNGYPISVVNEESGERISITY